MKKVYIFFVLLTLCTTVFSVEAREKSPLRIVKIGVYESNGFIALNEDNEMTGYGGNFMSMLSEYANIKYEYVRLTWSECLEKLKTGEIDIVTDARKTAEREKIFDFSMQNIGQIQASIFVLRNKEDIYFNDYKKLGTLKIGFEKDSMNKTLYEEYARQHEIACNAVEYPSNTDLMNALKKGEIDAFGNDSHLYTKELKVVSIYNTVPNYIMGLKNSDVIKRINLAVERMFSEHPDLLAEQYTYLPSRQLYGEILLTRAEAEYIQTHPVLKVTVPLDRKPASWFNSKTNEYYGIAIDMIRQLEKITGFKFEFCPKEENETVDSVLTSGKTDIYMPSIPTTEIEYPNVKITNPLYSLSVALAKKNTNQIDVEKPFSVAFKLDTPGIIKTLKDNFPNIVPKLYTTTSDCIKAVKQNKVAAFGNSLYEVEYYLQSPRNKNLSIEYSYTCPIDYCLSVSKNSPKELLNILNEGISLIPQKEAERLIRYYNTRYRYELTFGDKVFLYKIPLISIFSFLILALIIFCLYLHMQKITMLAIQKKTVEAQKANAAKSEFLARMSHDMRTPMNGILGLLQVNQDVPMPDEVKRTMMQIKMEGQYLQRIINNILEMSEIENKKISFDLEPISSKYVIDELFSIIQDYVQNEGIKVEIEKVNLKYDVFMIDKVRVLQILENILSNAIKFSKKGSTIKIRVERLDEFDNHCKVRVDVIDEGICISEEFMPRIFEPFERENQTDIYGGTGLGLTITRTLVEMMGAEMKIESKKGVGTKVTVIFNFEYGKQNSVAVEKKEIEEKRLNSIKILLCEDNKVNTFVTENIIKKQGGLIDCAQNGEEGVELFGKSAVGYYDIILMDIRMPVKDGVQATKEIRSMQREDAEKIPIIAVTANVFPDDIKNYYVVGMNDVVAKPIDANELINKIKIHLNK